MRFGSNFGRAMPAPTSTSVPAALELRERRLLAAAVARALERDVERLVDEVVRHRRGRRAPRASTDAGAELLAERAAALLRLAHDDVVDAERLERRDRQEPDRAAAGDEPAGAGPGAAGLGDAVQRDRERLGERRVLEREVVGHAQRLGGADRLVAGERALPVAVVGADPAPLDAQRRAGPRGSTRTCRTWATGPPTTRSPTAQPVTPGADRGDRARVLVALDHARPAAPLEEEVQVGAADPAVAHLEQQLARARARAWAGPRPRRPAAP